MNNFLANIMFMATETELDRIARGISNLVDTILTPMLFLIATAGIIYAVILGVNYAKAETSDKKDEAKKRIINAIVGIVIMVVLIVFMKYLTQEGVIQSLLDAFAFKTDTPVDTQ